MNQISHIPVMKGSLSSGAKERSRGGFVLLSIDGGGTGREKAVVNQKKKASGRGRVSLGW